MDDAYRERLRATCIGMPVGKIPSTVETLIKHLLPHSLALGINMNIKNQDRLYSTLYSLFSCYLKVSESYQSFLSIRSIHIEIEEQQKVEASEETDITSLLTEIMDEQSTVQKIDKSQEIKDALQKVSEELTTLLDDNPDIGINRQLIELYFPHYKQYKEVLFEQAEVVEEVSSTVINNDVADIPRPDDFTVTEDQEVIEQEIDEHGEETAQNVITIRCYINITERFKLIISKVFERFCDLIVKTKGNNSYMTSYHPDSLAIGVIGYLDSHNNPIINQVVAHFISNIIIVPLSNDRLLLSVNTLKKDVLFIILCMFTMHDSVSKKWYTFVEKAWKDMKANEVSEKLKEKYEAIISRCKEIMNSSADGNILSQFIPKLTNIHQVDLSVVMDRYVATMPCKTAPPRYIVYANHMFDTLDFTHRPVHYHDFIKADSKVNVFSIPDDDPNYIFALKYIKQIFNHELSRNYSCRVLGRALSKLRSNKDILGISGKTGGGKTTFLDIFGSSIEGNVGDMQGNQLTSKDSNTNGHQSTLVENILTRINDVNQGVPLSGSLLKNTGGDKIKVVKKYQEGEDARAITTAIITFNKAFTVDVMDEALIHRLIIFYFNNKFSGKELFIQDYIQERLKYPNTLITSMVDGTGNASRYYNNLKYRITRKDLIHWFSDRYEEDGKYEISNLLKEIIGEYKLPEDAKSVSPKFVEYIFKKFEGNLKEEYGCVYTIDQSLNGRKVYMGNERNINDLTNNPGALIKAIIHYGKKWNVNAELPQRVKDDKLKFMKEYQDIWKVFRGLYTNVANLSISTALSKSIIDDDEEDMVEQTAAEIRRTENVLSMRKRAIKDGISFEEVILKVKAEMPPTAKLVEANYRETIKDVLGFILKKNLFRLHNQKFVSGYTSR